MENQNQKQNSTTKKTNSLAIISFILSIVGIFIIPFLSSIAGFILGIISLNQIKKQNESGKGLAVAGIVIGAIGIIIIPLIIIGIIAFFGVVTPAIINQHSELVQQQCMISSGFSCLESGFSGNQIFLKVQNNLGYETENVVITMNEASTGWEKALSIGSLRNGEIVEASFPYEYNIDPFRGRIEIDYETKTGSKRTSYGTLYALR